MTLPLRQQSATGTAEHIVTGLSEVVVSCGQCRHIFKQPIDPLQRLSYLTCPSCNESAITRVAWNLIDEYEPRD